MASLRDQAEPGPPPRGPSLTVVTSLGQVPQSSWPCAQNSHLGRAPHAPGTLIQLVSPKCGRPACALGPGAPCRLFAESASHQQGGLAEPHAWPPARSCCLPHRAVGRLPVPSTPTSLPDPDSFGPVCHAEGHCTRPSRLRCTADPRLGTTQQPLC